MDTRAYLKMPKVESLLPQIFRKACCGFELKLLFPKLFSSFPVNKKLYFRAAEA